MQEVICLSPWKTPERGLIPRTATASSSRSLQRNPTGWAWGYRFAGRSSQIMADVWRSPPVSPMDRSSRYFYRFDAAGVFGGLVRFLHRTDDQRLARWTS